MSLLLLLLTLLRMSVRAEASTQIPPPLSLSLPLSLTHTHSPSTSTATSDAHVVGFAPLHLLVLVVMLGWTLRCLRVRLRWRQTAVPGIATISNVSYCTRFLISYFLSRTPMEQRHMIN